MHTTAAPLSPAQFRGLFPALDSAPHFASCSQGALSDHLAHTMQRMTASLIDAQAPWGEWVGKVEEYRTLSGRMLDVDSENVAVLSCASEAAFQVVSSLDWSGARRRLVTSDLEFPSVGNVWRAQHDTIEVVNVPGIEAALHADSWIKLIDERTKLVSIPLVSYINGTRPEIERVIAHAHSVGALVFVDAYQGAGVVPFSATELGCDFLVTGNLKYLLGLPGIAMLYVRDCVNVERAAALTGWFGRVNPFAFDAAGVDYPENARRFEMGTHPIPSAYAGVAGLETVAKIDLTQAWGHIEALRDRLAAELTAQGHVLDFPADAAHRGPEVAIVAADPDALAVRLAEHRIGTSPRGERLRLSFHAYSNDRDVDALVRALAELGGGAA
ncbi:aminotransferase class V-fold PLP-dependent enzyme [Leucobacter luti]|uniref:Selenocysteine lyase/cysteine desulfurase n=1 Tax=Leucobacter luti TaxID=340320 RepID=A0A4Q7TXS1_9MICO|nr:aminotransferase class V-fold PLP-dependent enzyme [Leucobacter luti]MBL3698641.1 aminotransferase class V-fold PLP-dependent enzyme [Leucobacter luti]RZT66016.1 selenocysteine lyase/cysteine desulfurase [Leucobacter luti]